MNRISKLAILSMIILLAVSYIWISNHQLALILGSISLVPFMRNVFEIKKYHNRNLYLALSAVILVIGIISTGIWILNLNQALYKIIIGFAAGLLILSTFQVACSSTRKWNRDLNISMH
jgi:hypothetical protein